MFKAKKIAKSILNLFGLTPYVYYTYKYNDPFKIKKKLFGDQNIIIFDVGAYDGRSAEKYAEKFPKSTIYSFEPTPNSFEKLSQSLSSNSQMHLHNIALSSFCGETDFYINNSSLVSTKK
jgi:tRNA G46 methylase TrmB